MIIIHEIGRNMLRHVRVLADLTGHGRADIVGLHDDGVYTALNNGDGTFAPAQPGLEDELGFNQAWRVDLNPRVLADLRPDGSGHWIGTSVHLAPPTARPSARRRSRRGT
jgi:hypothetical protein